MSRNHVNGFFIDTSGVKTVYPVRQNEKVLAYLNNNLMFAVN